MKKNKLKQLFFTLFLSSFLFTPITSFSEDKLNIDNITIDIQSFYNKNPTDTNIVSKFFSAFPFEYSIKTKYGSGKNMLILFMDANCPHCLNMEYKMSQDRDVLNTTAYIFLVDLIEDKAKINQFLWCSPINERSKRLHSWYDFRIKHQNMPTGIAFGQWKIDNNYKEIDNCHTPLAFNKSFMSSFLSDNNQIATPLFIFSNGMKHSGELEIESILNGFDTVKSNPLFVEGYEQINDNKIVELLKFYKDYFFKNNQK